jgi:hypothetical protein
MANSLQVELAKLRTIVEQTLGPDGSITKTLGEIKVDLKDGAKTMDDHSLRIDRLEQKQATRSKITWAITTAWVGLLATWFWNQIAKK